MTGAEEIAELPAGSVIETLLIDYLNLRDQIRAACPGDGGRNA